MMQWPFQKSSPTISGGKYDAEYSRMAGKPTRAVKSPSASPDLRRVLYMLKMGSIVFSRS